MSNRANLWDLVWNGTMKATTKLFKSVSGYHIQIGPTKPTDTTTGYAHGCIFVHSDGTTVNDAVYVNVGDTTSCNFDPVLVEGCDLDLDDITVDTITGNDASMALAGKAGSAGAGGAITITGGAGDTSGAGGAISVTGGAGAAAAGGAIDITGGAGNATGAGGAISIVGGASGAGATGAGGSGALTGGAALSTNGAGGAVAVTGGVGKGTGAGGAANLIGGASGGASGTGGNALVAPGSPTAVGGTQGRAVFGNVSGFADIEALPSRYSLRWVAGQRGKPSLNADIQNAAEATRMIADPDFEILGTNASSDDSTFYVEGGIQLETDGADNDQVILLPHLDANQSAWTQVTWGTDQETEWECYIRTTASITDVILWAGLKLTNTEVVATDNDQVFFRYEEGVNSGKWQAVSSIGGTDDAADAGVTVAINTAYRLSIKIDSSRIARMYINGVLVKTTAALTTTTDLIPYIGVMCQAGGASGAKSVVVRSQSISRKFA